MVHQVRFQIDNSTPYTLVPAQSSAAFAGWGDIARHPVTVPASTSDGENGGLVKASSAPFTSIPTYLCLVGSNPDMSTKDNWACVYITTNPEEAKAGKHLYNKVFDGGKREATATVDGGIFRVVAEIGQGHDCTALFRCTYRARATKTSSATVAVEGGTFEIEGEQADDRTAVFRYTYKPQAKL
ncbi:hypothetical protein K438DRAFT_1776942 [Mycena galopus ATCC 62051]|nr:hypothetical protein K438DRAFT_1776942 [Mycena galopus ATCC 62051]